MSWSKVYEPFNKPIGWWYFKLLCELGYFIEKKFNSVYGMKLYYKNLKKMSAKYGINIYGKKIHLPNP